MGNQSIVWFMSMTSTCKYMTYKYYTDRQQWTGKSEETTAAYYKPNIIYH